MRLARDSQFPSNLSPLAGGLLLFGAIARIAGFLQNSSLIGDEAMLALNIGRRSFTELLQPLDYAQIATVPFLYAERLLTSIAGVSGYTLRVIPLLAGIGLLYVVYRLAHCLLDHVETSVALALSASAYPLMRYSAEVKPYIIDSLISAVLLWMAIGVAANLNDRRRWGRFAIAGSLAVLFSTPALLVCAGSGAGLAVAAVRNRRLHLLPWIGLLGVVWGAIFRAAYVNWYAPNATASYMQEFWAGTFLRPAAPNFVGRLGLGFGELACTLTCWRGLFDLSPMLLLLAIIGTVAIAHHHRTEYAFILAGPILAAFGASMLGRYPIATRLVLFSAPSLVVLIASGAVTVARFVERIWPRVRARWVLLMLVYPSLIVAATLAFASPYDWGFRGVEVQPLAELFRERAGSEPVYVFSRTVPAWVFHTTNWSAPDTARLDWVAKIAGPDGPAFVNGASRGRRVLGEGADLVYSYHGGKELYGSPTGAQARMGIGYVPSEPDPGWAENEAWRMRKAANPYIWIVVADYTHGPLDEGRILINAVFAAGGEAVFSRAAANAMLLRVRFPPDSKE